MKRAAMALVFLMMILLATPAVAGVTETGFAVLLSVGDEERPIEASVVFTDMYGCILTPCSGVLVVPEGECFDVQVFPKGARGDKSFIIGYSTNTLLPKEPKRATYDPTYGWHFQLTAAETAQVKNLARALQLATTDRDGRKSWFRAVFKVTYGSGWLTRYDQIIIKTVPRSQMNTAGNVVSGSGASAAANANNEAHAKTAEYVSRLESRVTHVESYLERLSAGDGEKFNQEAIRRSSLASSEVEVRFKGEFVSLRMYIDMVGINATTEYIPVASASKKVSLTQGEHIVVLVVDYEDRQGVRKAPILVDIGPEDRAFSIDVSKGGAR